MKSKKVLFTSHTANFSKFNRPFMRWFKSQGYEVHYASAGEEEVLDCDKHFKISFERNPLKINNIKAYSDLKKIIDSENYEIIHTHTPVGSVITRLAAVDARKKGTRVIYTAHGFHFFKGAPLINWLTYYPIEKIMSKYTDALVTINEEDFSLALSRFYSKNTYIIDGVGVDLKRFKVVNVDVKNKLRKEYGFDKNDFILIYAAELNNNKNQMFLIEQLKNISKDIPNIKLLLCGIGSQSIRYANKINEFKLNKIVLLMGYRNDIDRLFNLSDVCVASSIREGFGLNLVEAMASGLPVVASDNRGHREIVVPYRNGFLFKHKSDDLTKSINALFNDIDLRGKIAQNNRKDSNKYTINKSLESMGKVYTEIITKKTNNSLNNADRYK